MTFLPDPATVDTKVACYLYSPDCGVATTPKVLRQSIQMYYQFCEYLIHCFTCKFTSL